MEVGGRSGCLWRAMKVAGVAFRPLVPISGRDGPRLGYLADQLERMLQLVDQLCLVAVDRSSGSCWSLISSCTRSLGEILVVSSWPWVSELILTWAGSAVEFENLRKSACLALLSAPPGRHIT